ncbi:MAG: hypothetical protein P8Y76_00025 [bacterium]
MHICVGTELGRARALMSSLRAKRPGWAVLELLSCPCCAGRAELQVRLARLLRERQPARVLIGFVEPSHRAALERTLTSWPLAQYVVPGRALSVPDDLTVAAELLEAS